MKPQIQRITEADRLNGVDLKFTLILQCTAHREKISLGTYGDWSNGPPSVFWLPIPMRFEFQRRNGVFEFHPSAAAKHCKSLMNFRL